MLVCQNFCLSGSFRREGQIAGTWQLQHCQQSHFSATVLRAGNWEAESGTSPASCLKEVGPFANQKA